MAGPCQPAGACRSAAVAILDRRLQGLARAALDICGRLGNHLIRPHRARDVLDPLLAEILEAAAELALEVVVGGAGDDDAAGLRQLLEARGDVHAIAVEIALVGHHVAEIDADAEADALVLGDLRLALRHAALGGDGAGDRIDHAAELAERAIAHELDDAALVLGDQRLDEGLAVGLEALERSRLVALDQARIADDVGRENGGEAAVDAGGGHGVTSNYSNASISTLAAASGASLVTSDAPATFPSSQLWQDFKPRGTMGRHRRSCAICRAGWSGCR